MGESGDPGLWWLGRRASSDAFFMGSALAEYQAIHSIDDRRLANILRCSTQALARLALCRRPDDQATRFREEVQRIATFASCNADRLAQLLREVAVVASFREGPGECASQGLLMAARDRRSGGKPPEGKPADKKCSTRKPEE